MHYIVSEKFFDAVSQLVEIATENESGTEFELAMGLLSDLVVDSEETREYYGESTE
jgi:hypothetical protein